ncbi:MAG: hypothetical protein WAS27_04570 [Candidatus Saccharimonadales bacterium]
MKAMYPTDPQQPQVPPARTPQPAPPPQAAGGFYSQPAAQQPQPYMPPPQAVLQSDPQPGFGPQPSPTYAVDYLDQIAPPPPRPNFLSGMFGKAVIILGVIFVLAVSLIVAFGNQKRTADLEKVAIRLENMQKITKSTHVNLKSSKLLATNSNYQIWIANATKDAWDLLGQAEVKRTKIDKKMIADEKDKRTELTDKFYDARLNATLDRFYAREMAYQTQLLVTDYTTMSKQSQAGAIRDYAKRAITNLTPIQKSFAEFDDSI